MPSLRVVPGDKLMPIRSTIKWENSIENLSEVSRSEAENELQARVPSRKTKKDGAQV